MKFFAVLIVAFTFGACSSGSIIVTGTVRQPIAADQVRVYAEPPAEYEVIAVLESAPGSGWTDQGCRDDAIEDLKEKAASVGATGVLLTGEVSTSGGSGAGVGAVGGGGFGVSLGLFRYSQSLHAKAIYLIREK